MLNTNTVIDGKYRLLSELGSGEFGNVWDVLDVEDGDRKALKMSPCESKAFNREVKFLRAAFQISGINQMLSSFQFENWSCLVLSLEGETLDTVMRRSDTHGVSVHNLRRIMYSVGQTLKQIHSLGFVHRDLHARNILVTHSDSKCLLKVIDFGVCVERKDGNGAWNNNDQDDDSVNFMSARHSSFRLVRYGDYLQQDDWISLIYILIHYNGVKFGDDGIQMICDKYNFDEKPHEHLRPELHWIADCYQLLMESNVNFDAVLSSAAGEDPEFDVESPFEFEKVDDLLKFK